jgi:HEAT repeat protein
MMADQESRVQQLIARLRHEDPVVRIHAGILLGDMGPAARKAIPSLLDLLNSGSVQDRKLAVVTLGPIGAAEAILALRHALRDTDDGVRRLVASVLAKIDATAPCEKAA